MLPAPVAMFVFSSRRRHTRLQGDWSSDVCSSDLERTRDGHLDGLLRVGAQKADVLDLDGMLAPDRPDDAGNGLRTAGAAEGRARAVDVDAFERGREAVRIALAPNLTIRDDVEPRLFLRSDREPRRVVLRLTQPTLGNAPQLSRADARRTASGKLLAIDQPLGLGIAADQRRGKQHAVVRPPPALPRQTSSSLFSR